MDHSDEHDLIYKEMFIDVMGNRFVTGKRKTNNHSMGETSCQVTIKHYPIPQTPFIFFTHLQSHTASILTDMWIKLTKRRYFIISALHEQ